MKTISTNPSRNYEVIDEVEASTDQEVEAAVTRAYKAQPEWQAMGLAGRNRALTSFISLCRNQHKEIAKLIAVETGRTIEMSRADVNEGISYFESFMGLAEKYLANEIVFENETEIQRTVREPRGVVACITPWNFPFLSIPWQAGQALLAGNAVVYKTSEECILFGKLIEKIVKESDIPEGVFEIIHGDSAVGESLIHQPVDAIMFTGSTDTGRHIAKVAGETMTPFFAEMGGSAPAVVFEDCIVDDIVETIYATRFSLSGQDCCGMKRLIVHESKAKEIIDKLVKIINTKKIGDATIEDTDIGPLVAKRQLEKLEAQVQDALEKDATVVTGGKQPEGLKGAYYEPTILTNITRNMKIWSEEVFGPVLPVTTFKTEEEAIALANDTIYGLGAYIFTNNKQLYNRVALQIQSGEISQNNASFFSPNSPFGGYKQSGNSYTCGQAGFNEVTKIKLISEEK